MAVIGVLAVMFGMLAFAVAKLSPSYETMAREEFGTPDALSDLLALYARIEAAQHEATLTVIEVYPKSRAKCRRIPRAALPDRFQKYWGETGGIGTGIAMPPDVIAYYDTSDRLIGVQFGQTRYGCFISRDAMACPENFGALYRLRHEAPYVTVWVEAPR